MASFGTIDRVIPYGFTMQRLARNFRNYRFWAEGALLDLAPIFVVWSVVIAGGAAAIRCRTLGRGYYPRISMVHAIAAVITVGLYASFRHQQVLERMYFNP